MSLTIGICRMKQCEHLKSVIIETVRGPRRSSFCDITGKIPGNMYKCPVEDET